MTIKVKKWHQLNNSKKKSQSVGEKVAEECRSRRRFNHSGFTGVRESTVSLEIETNKSWRRILTGPQCNNYKGNTAAMWGMKKYILVNNTKEEEKISGRHVFRGCGVKFCLKIKKT